MVAITLLRRGRRVYVQAARPAGRGASFRGAAHGTKRWANATADPTDNRSPSPPTTLAVGPRGEAGHPALPTPSGSTPARARTPGQLRVVEGEDQCHRSETALTLEHPRTRGAVGPTGPAGQPVHPAAKDRTVQRAPTERPTQGPAGDREPADPGPGGKDGARAPKGDAGPAGAKGPQGPPGRGGGSTARAVSRGVGPTNFGTLPASLTVATMADVAAGDYLVLAKTTVRVVLRPHLRTVNCQLRADAMVIDHMQVGGADLTSAAVSLQSTASFSSTSGSERGLQPGKSGQRSVRFGHQAERPEGRPGVGRGSLGREPGLTPAQPSGAARARTWNRRFWRPVPYPIWPLPQGGQHRAPGRVMRAKGIRAPMLRRHRHLKKPACCQLHHARGEVRSPKS